MTIVAVLNRDASALSRLHSKVYGEHETAVGADACTVFIDFDIWAATFWADDVGGGVHTG